MRDLAAAEGIGGTVALYDIDQAAAGQNALIGNRLSRKTGASWTYRAEASLEGALGGADFVIISILPGTFAEMASDVHAPEAYGVYQSVGDSVGPGGVIRAMRTLPMYEVIAQAIERSCPDGWVINYTNPMAACVGCLYRVFPGIKAIGCCHEVFGAQHLLCEMLDVLEGVRAERCELETNVLGVNHYTVIDRASWRGLDLSGLIARFAERYWATGYTPPGQEDYRENPFTYAHRVKLDMYKRYGVLGAAGDRHLAEFFPNPWYLGSAENAASWTFGLTPVSWRIRDLEDRLARAGRLASGQEELDLTPTGEEGVKQIKALLGLTPGFVTNVNLPNSGQFAGMPGGAIVETNAYISKDSIKPIFSGSQPAALAAVTRRHCENQLAMSQAAALRDGKLAFEVFCNEPALGGLSMPDLRALFDTTTKNTAEYLKDWKF